jgi:cleavage and polyadenylation specificity factor subunit 5
VHGCAHVLLLEHGNELRLPGGRLRAGEAEADGLRRKLQSKLGASQPELAVRWDISELLAAFHRPHFTEHLYPFQPPHVTRLKEVHRLFAVQLPEHATFAVPKPSRLVAVPLFELHDNAARYGPVLASVPALLSRLQMNVQESSSSTSIDAGATNDHDHQP